VAGRATTDIIATQRRRSPTHLQLRRAELERGAPPFFHRPNPRFVNQLRAEKVGSESANVELRQELRIAIDSGDDAETLNLRSEGTTVAIPLTRAGSLKASTAPGFFEIDQGSEPRFIGAANFADTREADFSEAAPFSELKALPAKITENKTVSDPSWQLWLLAILAAILTAWALINRKEREGDKELPA
jgi:hypothetical protein